MTTKPIAAPLASETIDITSYSFRDVRVRQSYPDTPTLWIIEAKVNKDNFYTTIADFCDGGCPGRARQVATLFFGLLAAQQKAAL